MEQPRVSVVIPVFNCESSVARAIDSILAQEFEGTEIVVVDDGSTDATPQALDRYRDRVHVIRQENRGSPAARNVGVEASRAPYVAFLDADDVWLAGRLEKTFAALDSAPDAVLAYADVIVVDERGQPTGGFGMSAHTARAPSLQDLLTKGWWPILPTTALFRRDAYLAVGGFCEEFKGARGFADVWFFLLMRERGRFIYLPEPLARYGSMPFLDRCEKYAPGFVTFSRLMTERHGAAGNRAVLIYAELNSRPLVEMGVRAMDAGQMKDARRALLCAARYKRLDRRNLLRLMRAYLPVPIALALASRKRRERHGTARDRVALQWTARK